MADNPVVNSVIATDGTNTSTLAANGLTVTGGPSVTTTGIDAGGKKVTNVAAGDISATSTDAINGSQLNATNVQVTNNTNNINGLKDDALQWDATLNAYSANHMGSGTAKITNVAAGELSDTSTDAVNGSQLYATNEQVTTNTTNINGLKDDALQWDATLNAYSANHMGSGTAKITNVAAGELSDTSTDAVNGSQLKETNDQVTNNTTNIANNLTEITNLGDEVDNIYNTGTKYFHANSTGTDSVASGVDAVAIGMGAIASADGSVALGAGSVADGSTLANQAYLVGGTAKGEVNVGDRRLTGLAAGADDMDGVNVAQLKAVTANSVADAVMYDDSTHNNITLGGDTYNNSTHTGGTTITNVADGAAPSDAVNYSQLSETNTNVTNLGDTVTNLGDEVDNIYNTGTKYFHANSTGTDSSATGVDAIAIGMGSVADVARSVALGDGAKTLAAVGTSSVTIGGENYDFAGTAPVGTVSIGDAGEERTLTNVAAGRLSDTSTDAVNGSQLFASNQAIDSITNNFNGLDGRAVKYDLNADGTVNHDRITLEGAPTQITNVKAGELSDTSTDAVNGSQLNATNEQVTNNTTNIANNTTDIATNTTNIANNTVNIDGLKDDALQWDATANGGNGAYSANHMGNGPAKITNVAAGELSDTSTDAVNGSQLKETNDQVTNNTTNIANNLTEITNLGDEVDNIYNTGTKYFHANSTGTDSVASGVDAVAIGMGAIASADG
ncbi:beta strand repeat-containing protein, partial [Serratia fonticola]|uniref:beta strand repeat-containing protein n=1 Tax=Serratia fonticola TaxID=47917 RepID=UPI0036F21E35